MIDHYTTGSHMTVRGTRYRKDLKIIHGEVMGNWWRKEGHRLAVGDIDDILTASPQILVIGTGYAGNMRVPDTVRQTGHRSANPGGSSNQSHRPDNR
jgi:hypothetical protein